ncbi:MAG: hypothetical protein O3B86_14655 [Planctomycetota bacterium]|nr:hypothetical protein [Planctomycetota bacterium]
MRIAGRRRATPGELGQAAHDLISSVLELGEAGTDDAHARFELPTAVDQRAWGSVTAGLLTAGVIRRVGDRHTRRAIAHGRRIGRYRTANTDEARRMCEKLSGIAAEPRAVQLVLPGMVARAKEGASAGR